MAFKSRCRSHGAGSQHSLLSEKFLGTVKRLLIYLGRCRVVGHRQVCRSLTIALLAGASKSVVVPASRCHYRRRPRPLRPWPRRWPRPLRHLLRPLRQFRRSYRCRLLRCPRQSSRPRYLGRGRWLRGHRPRCRVPDRGLRDQRLDRVPCRGRADRDSRCRASRTVRARACPGSRVSTSPACEGVDLDRPSGCADSAESASCRALMGRWS